MCYDKRTNCFKLIIGKFSRIVFFVSRTGRLRSDLQAVVCPRRLSMAQEAVGGPESFLAGV